MMVGMASVSPAPPVRSRPWRWPRLLAAVLCAMLCAGLMPWAGAASPLDDWRADLADTRALVFNDVTHALRQAQRLQQQVPAGATPADRVQALNVLTRAEIYAAIPAAATRHIAQAIEQARSAGNAVGEAEAQLNAALNYVNGSQPLPTLVGATTRALALLDGVDRPDLLGEALLLTSGTHLRLGQFDEAVAMAVQSLEIARRNKHPLALAFAHQAMLITLNQNGRSAEARGHAAEMRVQARRAGSRLHELQAIYSEGALAQTAGELPQAGKLLRESLDGYRAIGARFIEGQALFGLAGLLRAEGHDDQALGLLAEALAVYEGYSNSLGIWHTLNARADLALALGRQRAAQADAERAYEIAGTIGVLRYRSESARRMATMLAAAGNPRRAYELGVEAAALADQAVRERASARLAEVIERYESESRQREVAELTRRNEQQSAQLAQHALQQRWLWTLLGAGAVTLTVTAYFLLRLRRSHATLARTYAELKRSRDHIEERKAAESAREAALAEAERLARTRSEFLAQMSHELRTPLNGILGFAQILQHDGQLSERQARGVGVIQKSGQHLLTLINDILDLARVDAGKMVLSPSEIALPAFLDVVAEMIRVKADEKGLGFECHAVNLPASVRADELRLRQVLLNLLSNAVKFTDAGRVTLRAAGLPGAAPDTVRLRFEVQDSGIGMDDEQLARLFRPFEQVGDASRRAGGTGLGLAISRQLVRMMGADIDVTSQPGVGSTFCFEIELPAASASAAPAPGRSRVVGYRGPRRKVLVVDDAAAIRTLLSDALQPLGFEVAEAHDGEVGFERALRHPPDLVVMDMSMPVMDGCEATRLMRGTPQLASVPLIATSANATREVETRFRDAGATRFLKKPFDTRELLEAIGEELQLSWIVRETG